MVDIVLIGINHKTAPVELRECLAFAAEEAEEALRRLVGDPAVREALLYSTCNRVELLMAAEDRDGALAAGRGLLAARNRLSPELLEGSLYIHENDEAVRHLFRVASSLDSLVVGEPQILGQIKEAYRQALRAKSSGVILNRLMHRAFFVAKRVRTETGIGGHAVSVSYAAVELGRKIFGDLAGKRVLLIGAGEMAELAVEHLLRQKVAEILVANRTYEHGLELARRFQGRALRFEDLPAALTEADIILSSTGAPGFILTRDQIRPVLRHRRNRPLFFIDIAVPRDIDPDINRLENAYVYDIDDLQGVVEENRQDRMKEAVKGERLIDEAVVRFRQWREGLEVVPTIVALHRKLEAIGEQELRRTAQSRRWAEEDVEAARRMLAAFINKALHEPTVFLKRQGHRTDQTVSVDFVRKLFRLDE